MLKVESPTINTLPGVKGLAGARFFDPVGLVEAAVAGGLEAIGFGPTGWSRAGWLVRAEVSRLSPPSLRQLPLDLEYDLPLSSYLDPKDLESDRDEVE